MTPDPYFKIKVQVNDVLGIEPEGSLAANISQSGPRPTPRKPSDKSLLIRSQYIKVRKLLKGGNYSRAETIRGNTVLENFGPLRSNFWT